MSRRSMSPEFDQRIADWLEDDPDHAPEPVLSTVLAAFPSIPQRRAWRVPWRTRPMTTMTSRLLAGAALAVVLVGGAIILRTAGGPGVGASAPPPSPSVPLASPPAALVLEKTFVSDRYGYSVDYPIDWTTIQSSQPWKPGEVNLWGSGINDELKGAEIRFSGASQALAAGQTADAWLRAYGSPVTALAGNGGDPATWPKVSIDGLDGLIDIDGGPADGGMVPNGGRMFDAVVISGRLAYNFNMDGNVDRGTFLELLASVKLPVIPALDKTFTSMVAGYSLTYPSSLGLTVASAQKAWTSGYDTSDDTIKDVFVGQSSFDGTSTKIPPGMTFDQWYAAFEAAVPSGTCGAPPSTPEVVLVDGVAGRLDTRCPASRLEVVVPDGGRAYVFTFHGRVNPSGPANRPFFSALLDTVRLTPATAQN
jgi:hypothetical protein